MKVKTFTTVFYWVFPAVVAAVTAGLLSAAVPLILVAQSQAQVISVPLGQSEIVVRCQQSAEPSAEASVHTWRWMTYRNEELGFELKYPAEWTFSPDVGGSCDRLSVGFGQFSPESLFKTYFGLEVCSISAAESVFGAFQRVYGQDVSGLPGEQRDVGGVVAYFFTELRVCPTYSTRLFHK